MFRILRIKDKSLRELISGTITQSLKKASPQLARQVLNFLEETVLGVDAADDESTGSAAIQSLAILIAVYAKGQSNDARPINIIANVGLNDKHTKLMLLALNFLIGQNDSINAESDDNADDVNDDDDHDANRPDSRTIRSAYAKMKIAGKTKARQARLDRLIRKSKQGGQRKHRPENYVFPAIQLLHDPQRYAERLLANLRRSSAPFEAKLTMMNALSLIIAAHQLIIPEFYPVLLRYLQPHQRHVTRILCFCAQASHAALPGDLLTTMVKAIANNFVSDHCAAPVIAAGLNAIRECCCRCPAAMDEALLQDLTQYKGYKDKGVMMAARSLIGLYRQIGPGMLHRRDRGRPESRRRSVDECEEDQSESDDGDDDDQKLSNDLLLQDAQSRVLSQSELETLKDKFKGRDSGSASTIHPNNILSNSHRKQSKAERLAHVRAGRQSDRKFGAAGKTAMHRASGKSQPNKVKRRAKNFNMIKRSKAGLYGGLAKTRQKKGK